MISLLSHLAFAAKCIAVRDRSFFTSTRAPFARILSNDRLEPCAAEIISLVAVPSLHVPPYRDPSLSESKGAFADAEEEEEEEEDEDIVTLTLLLKK